MSLFSSIVYSIFVDFNKSSSQKKKEKIIKQKLHKIKICCMNVTYTKNTKFLGVIIANKLRWSDHIIYITKIAKSIGIIYKTRNFLIQIP